jgi:hypothetical protein
MPKVSVVHAFFIRLLNAKETIVIIATKIMIRSRSRETSADVSRKHADAKVFG